VTYEDGEGILNIVQNQEMMALFDKMKLQLDLKTDVLVEGYSSGVISVSRSW